VTLLEQAERLKTLAENVEAAADAERAARALDAVRHQVAIAKSAVLGYELISAHAQDVSDEAVRTVQQSARALIEVLAPFVGAEDAVLAAYGANSDASTTGVLGSVSQRAEVLRNALEDAQRQALLRWAERVWPGSDLARLEALAAIEARAKAALDLRAELVESTERTLGALSLERLAAKVAEAQDSAAQLREQAPPSAVIAFYDRLKASADGVPLNEVDAFVLQWLVEHAAGELRLQKKNET
jgi:hypothetical protein